MHMNIHSNAKPNRTQRPNAASVDGTSVCTRNPTAKPIAAVIASPQVTSAVSASARPVGAALRRIGRERSRSNSPLSTSSATPAAAPAPENRTPVVMKPGTRKST